MKLIERTCENPAENIALDEALLLEAEREPVHPGFLRIWEPAETLVVVGRGSAVSREVDLQRCDADRVAVLRRSSGGAAIVLGPGCLMYAVVLSCEQYPALRAIDQAHRFVLSRLSAALAQSVPGIRREGISDLAVGDRKVSGNSLRCRRNHLLYHGTLLYDMSLAPITRYLRSPPRQPSYRSGRPHGEFVANMKVPREVVRKHLLAAWQNPAAWDDWPSGQTAELVAAKYSRSEWTMQIP